MDVASPTSGLEIREVPAGDHKTSSSIGPGIVVATLETEAIDSSSSQNIPPQDKGFQAWKFLVGASLIESVTWGFPSCYGVFREYFFVHEPYTGNSSMAVVGVVANGILQLSSPFFLYFFRRSPALRKPSMWLGMMLCVLSSIGGAFSRKPYQFIASQGVLYGIGAGLLFAPTLSFMSEWFNKRRSLAYGIMFAWIGASGAFLPTVYSVLLNKYGSKVVLVGWAIVVMVLTTTALFCVQPRLPTQMRSNTTDKASINLVKLPFFWLLITATFLHGLVHYLPSTYLPSYGTSLGFSSTKSALLLSILNLAMAVGQPLIGLLLDHRTSFWAPMFMSTFISGLSTLIVWGFGHTYWSLIIYVIIFGGTSGGIQVLRSRFASAIVGKDNEGSALIMYGILTATRGVAMISSGFIGTALTKSELPVTNAYGAGKWRDLIIFSGTVMICAGFGALGKWCRSSVE